MTQVLLPGPRRSLCRLDDGSERWVNNIELIGVGAAGDQHGAAPRTGDFMKFHCGDRVYDAHDEGHVGRLEAIDNSAVAKIRWSNGWVSNIPLHRVRKEK
jgi:hypothetical protein